MVTLKAFFPAMTTWFNGECILLLLPKKAHKHHQQCNKVNNMHLISSSNFPWVRPPCCGCTWITRVREVSPSPPGNTAAIDIAQMPPKRNKTLNELDELKDISAVSLQLFDYTENQTMCSDLKLTPLTPFQGVPTNKTGPRSK